MLAQQFSYSDNVKADVDYPLSKRQPVSEIIRALRSYTWGVQNPAVVRLLQQDWSKITGEAFILGRNFINAPAGMSARPLSY